YISCIKQFWNSVSVKRSGDITRLQALVNKKKIVISEAVIREILQLNDAEGVVCLPNEEILAGLAQMGYEKPSTKLTFYKAFFSSQWKFLIHTILQSLSAKRTSWNEFSIAIASVVICLSKGQKFNFSKYIFDSLVRNVDSSSKFYMVGKGFSRVEAPLFKDMIAQRQPAEEEVEGLENDKAAQQLEIVKLKARVKKLEKINMVKSSKLRRLKKVGTSQRVESSDDMENVFNQGRIIADMDQDEGIELVVDQEKDAKVEGRHADKQAELYNLDQDYSSKVVTASTPIPAAKSKILNIVAASAVSTRRIKGVVIRDPEEELPSDTPAETPQVKDKGKGILIEAPKPMKKKDQIEMDAEYARKLQEEINKEHEETYKNIDWNAALDHGIKYDEILPIFQAKFDANMRFLFKLREEMEEEDQEIIKSINETPAQKAAKRRKLKLMLPSESKDCQSNIDAARLKLKLFKNITAAEDITKVLVNKSQNKTPYELFNGRTRAIGFLKPFGCHVMILNTLDHLGKFKAKGDEGYFIGYSMSSKAFRVFNKRTKRVEENLHVDFLENKAIEKGTKDAVSQEVKKYVSSLRYISLPNWIHEALLESSSSNAQDTCNVVAPESSGNPNPTATTTNPLADQMETLIVETSISSVSSPVLTACFKDSPEPLSTTRIISKRVTSQDVTPSLDNISTLANRFDDILGVTTSTVDSHGEEADVSNMETTITASPTPTLKIHKDHPKRVRPIRTKWVLKNKKDERGIVIRNKARLVTQGHTQEEGIDYDEVFTPVASIKAIRLFLAYASFMGFTVYQMNVKSAFLYEGKEEISYMYKSMWMILSFGSSNPQLCREFEALMHEKFQMSAMGELNFFFGLQVLQKKDGIFLSQDKYVGDIIKKFGYSDVRSANTPMDKENPWGKDGTGKDVDLHLYRSMIGSLMQITASRPDIMFCCLRLISWQCKKQTIVATLTTEAEYVAAASSCRQVLWIQMQLLDYGQYTRRARIAQSSALPPVADEPASPIGDDSQGKACPTVSGLEAEQDRENITKTSTLPNTPIKGRSLDEGEEADIERSTEKGSNDIEEMVNVLTSLDVVTVLSSGVSVSISPVTEVYAAKVPTGSGSIPTTSPPGTGVRTGGIPTGSDVVPTASLIFTTATVATPYTRRKDARIAKIHAEEELQIMIDGLDRNNETFAKYLQEYYKFARDLPIGERIELISTLVKYQDNYAKVLKYQIQQRKPLSREQQKEFYMSVLKSHAGWKARHFKGMTLEKIKEKFDPVWKHIQDFIPIGSKEESERFKRKGIRLEQDSIKKLKTSEEIPEEKLKEMMELIPIEEVCVEALQVKHPIID
nr:hypothetical protein [Tanacetum cinerariifolium]